MTNPGCALKPSRASSGSSMCRCHRVLRQIHSALPPCWQNTAAWREGCCHSNRSRSWKRSVWIWQRWPMCGKWCHCCKPAPDSWPHRRAKARRYNITTPARRYNITTPARRYNVTVGACLGAPDFKPALPAPQYAAWRPIDAHLSRFLPYFPYPVHAPIHAQSAPARYHPTGRFHRA